MGQAGDSRGSGQHVSWAGMSMKIESQLRVDGLDERIVFAERRRQRVFRRWWLGVVVCLMALVGLRLGWGLYAGRQLAAEIERIRAAGEPILFRDFDPPREIADMENAAVMYRAAAAAIVEPEGLPIESYDLLYSLPNRSQYPDEIRLIVAANAKAMQLFREARGLSAVDWGVRFTSPMLGGSIGFPIGRLDELQAIGELAAITSHRDGDDRNAIETLRDMNAWVNAQIRPRTTHVSTLSSAYRESQRLVRAIETIAPELTTVEQVHGAGQSDNAALRAQVQVLINDLLDESQLREGWRRALFVDRAALLDQRDIDATRRVAGGGTAAILYAIGAPAWDARLTRDLAVFAKKSATGWGDISSRVRLYSVFRGPPGLRFFVLASRRMAAITLSIRMFELDHDRRPSELSELVPRYLEALPHDPFAPEGQVFCYVLDGAAPMLYSFGGNERDDGGKIAIRDDGVIDSYRMDMPYFLDGRPDDETLATISAAPQSSRAQNENDD